MSEPIAYGIEIALGMIAIPWVAFVTGNIFSLRQQLAVLKAELSVLREIKDMIHKQVATP